MAGGQDFDFFVGFLGEQVSVTGDYGLCFAGYCAMNEFVVIGIVFYGPGARFAFNDSKKWQYLLVNDVVNFLFGQIKFWICQNLKIFGHDFFCYQRRYLALFP